MPCLDQNKLDCAGHAELRDLATGVLVPPGKVLTLAAGSLARNAEVDLAFSLVNTASLANALPLRVTAVRLDALPPVPAGEPAFSCRLLAPDLDCGDVGAAKVDVLTSDLLAAGVPGIAALQVRVRYRHLDDQPRAARLCLDVQGDPTLATGSLCVDFKVHHGTPKLHVTPAEVFFPYIAAGTSSSTQVGLTNVGDGPLGLASLAIQGDGALTAQLADGTAAAGQPLVFSPPFLLPPGQSATVAVTCTPKADQAHLATLEIVSAQPAVPKVVVPLSCGATVPCLKLAPADLVQFGAVPLGEAATRDVELVSCGSGPVEVTSLALAPGGSAGFALDVSPLPDATTPSQGKPLVLAPNQTAVVRGVFQPETVSKQAQGAPFPTPDQATLVVQTNVGQRTVTLSGVGVQEPCPIAQIDVLPGDAVVPQTTVELDGSGSQGGPGATVKTWKWSLQKKPAGVHLPFQPSAKLAKTKVKLDAAGTYVFCLQVLDTAGKSSCVETCRAIEVVPDACLHVELLWSTPADTDPTDSGPGAGADLDLHFAHAKATGPDLDCDGAGDPWYHNPFDVFWNNAKPNWGSVAAEVADDPSLDLDDTDGHGPESLSLVQPEGSVGTPAHYSVGVHYWNDYGYGTSIATVRIYVCGEIKYEATDVALEPLDFWYVGKVWWPNVHFGGGALPVVKECLQTGDACLAKKTPGAPGGGLMWQSQGMRCVTPCYVHPLTPPGAAPVCKQ